MKADLRRGNAANMTPGRDVGVPATRRLARIKSHKAAAPQDTVAEIRVTREFGSQVRRMRIHEEDVRFSYYLQLGEDLRGGAVFQTMGKGRTDAYANASARRARKKSPL